MLVCLEGCAGVCRCVQVCVGVSLLVWRDVLAGAKRAVGYAALARGTLKQYALAHGGLLAALEQ